MILKRLTETLDAGIHWVDVDYLRVVELALETGLSTYAPATSTWPGLSARAWSPSTNGWKPPPGLCKYTAFL